jgi:hypothetical protein
MAPRRRRSLLRRLPRALGAALLTSMASTHTRHQTPRPEARAPSRCKARRPSPSPMERAPAVATLVYVVAAVVVWGAPLASADVVPPPPTTTSEAPPPDPYKAPVRTTKPKPATPRRVAPVSRPAVVSPARSYTPTAVIPPPLVPARQVKPKKHAKVARAHRAKPTRHVVPISLAPVSHVVEAARMPVPVAGDGGNPYLWLSGISFAVLAVAGFGLLLLTQRTFRTEWE